MGRAIKPNAIECCICHKEKFINLYKARGQTSLRCHNCGRFITLNWDDMTAEESKPIKGAFQMVVNQ